MQLVLVKGFSSKSTWMFPRGKINKDEPESRCAVREVLEETNYDISSGLVEADFLEAYSKEQRIRLYIIQSVPMDYPFSPRTRKEISVRLWGTL